MIDFRRPRIEPRRRPRPALAGTVIAHPLVLLLLAWPTAASFGQPPDLDFPTTDGTVRAFAIHENTLYVGGSFHNIGRPTGGAVPIDPVSGVVLPSFPRVNGTVRAVAPDGAGGWFIGGDFTAVSGVTRNRLAHVLSDLTLGAWNPGANDEVRALARDGSTLYVGGRFTSIGGQARNRIAALSTSTGLATGWNPNADSYVLGLTVDGSTVYAGGDFATIGGQTRHHVAALNAASGLATAWDPNVDFWVWRILVSGSTVYIGGNFQTVGAAARSNIAAIDAATGTATSWNPGANNGVAALLIAGTKLYVGGAFTSIGGKARNRLAEVDLGNGTVSNWNPNADYTVYALGLAGNTLYVGGEFASMGGAGRGSLAAVDLPTGNVLPWDPQATGGTFGAYALDVTATTVFAGGGFTIVGSKLRDNIAAIDLATKTVTSWNPVASWNVHAIRRSGSTVYVGGDFVNIGGRDINYIAALDATTGLASNWDPQSNGPIHAIDVDGSTVYVGGAFTQIGLQPRNQMAALNAGNAHATSWNPQANASAAAIRVVGSIVYVSGGFTSVGLQPRRYLAQLDKTLATATDWDPGIDGPVRAMQITDPWVYAGGAFDTVDYVQHAGGVTAVDAVSATPAAWDALGFGIDALVQHGSSLYVGGGFQSVGHANRNRVAALDLATGLATAWNPNLTGGDGSYPTEVLALEARASTIYVGGNFTNVGLYGIRGLAAIEDPSLVGVPEPGQVPGSDMRLTIAPTPMRHRGHLFFTLPQAATVSIDVFDLGGRRIQRVIEEASFSAGPHDVALERGRLRTGIYFVRLSTGPSSATRKLVIVED